MYLITSVPGPVAVSLRMQRVAQQILVQPESSGWSSSTRILTPVAALQKCEVLPLAPLQAWNLSQPKWLIGMTGRR